MRKPTSASTASPSCRSTASTAPWATRAATRCARSSPTIASPATIRPLAPCDIKDYDALDRLGGAIFQRWGKLDIFVGNAGILGPITPLSHLDPKQWDDVMAVNVTANWRLIRSLDALLRASDAGRVALMSSGAGNKTQFAPYWGAYAASKAAVDALVRTYAAETVNTSAVKVMAVNPGTAAHAHARLRHARRRPDDAEDARGHRAEDRRTLRAGMDANRETLRLPAGPGAELPGAGVSPIPPVCRGVSGRRAAGRSA
jgi:NAD(P)-dependent dehydrogenase (short-subunit alcohol dehydrogenase family)